MGELGSLRGLLDAVAQCFESLSGVSGVLVDEDNQAVVYCINGVGLFRVEVAASSFQESVQIAVSPK